jgi:hypothetical protein
LPERATAVAVTIIASTLKATISFVFEINFFIYFSLVLFCPRAMQPSTVGGGVKVVYRLSRF